MFGSPRGLRTAVAIPVRNEEARIGACLDALAHQRDFGPDAVVLLLNNCTDNTASIVARAGSSQSFRLHVVTHDFAPGDGNAGQARALAMNEAAVLAGLHGVILTTDADGRVAPDWLAANLRALAGGADAVAGRAVIDPVEALRIPQKLHDDDARECAYGELLDEIVSLLDPDPADPWPRHTEESGASLAVSTAWYHRVGGMPPVALGEDRAFVASLRRHDAKVRHAPDVWVTVSGRTEGRAAGGMADTILRRLGAPDAFLDDRLEPASDAARRARWRHQIRVLTDSTGYFGAAWSAIETAVPALYRKKVLVSDLAHQLREAQQIALRLRNQPVITATEDPIGSLAHAVS